MGFVSEKEEENQSLSMGRNTKASLMGGSWWWQNVKPFVNGGSAALLTELQFLLVDSAIYYLGSYEKESAAKAFKQLPHLQNFKDFDQKGHFCQSWYTSRHSSGSLHLPELLEHAWLLQ
ncbi:PREDICTED: uncharacterized protein LOC105142314 [Populus euphratica]|uniref:Uncharacterized protein LOC105142314 n=1 Tax=Populus euphratica TaxID=75702 RepID=A0AAJ6YA77_POPEU|nr:PREDICTED: uncharacterized protein LOC105142314 [Populus euphratica]